MKKPLFLEIRNQLFIYKLALAAIFFLLVIGQGSAKAIDTTPPQISDFSFSPSTIDTTNSSQTVTVTIRATDAERGVNNIAVGFRSLTGNQFLTVYIDSRHRISGNSQDGVYRAEATFLQYSKAGTWNVFQIYATDGINYKIFYSAELAELGFATELQIISKNEDITPPEISEFNFTPTAINTTGGSQNVTVTVRVKDTQIGVRSISVGFLREDYVYGFDINSSHRISGDNKDGVYKRVVTFPQNIPSGMYDVYVSASDALGNANFLDSVELFELGYPPQLRVNLPAPTELVTISGQVFDTRIRGVSKAVVTLTESNGNVRYATTNPFGYYRFDQVRVGNIYTVKVQHKRYIFPSQVLFIGNERPNTNFFANQ
ncbi:MAG: carboxypeptidase-like regulatory domain-containing protein [Acidobacteriota bacterium]|nr:carboxypeptidase-like regulatory domain-containing protein [Acidobacteriota bacterium]